MSEARAEQRANKALDCELQKDWLMAAAKWGEAAAASKTRKKEYLERQANAFVRSGRPGLTSSEPMRVVPDERLAESAKLLEEAMGEIERLTARCFELEKIASQLGPVEDLSGLLVEARAIRLMADPDDNESVRAALLRRRAAPAHAVIDLAGAAEVEKTLNEAATEIDRLQNELSARPSEDEWRQIRALCGQSIDDGVAVIDVLDAVRTHLGDEYKDEPIDIAVDSAINANDEELAKAKDFDRVKSGLSLIAADGLRQVLAAHDCRLRQSWLSLDVYEQKRMMEALEDKLETWIDGGA